MHEPNDLAGIILALTSLVTAFGSLAQASRPILGAFRKQTDPTRAPQKGSTAKSGPESFRWPDLGFAALLLVLAVSFACYARAHSKEAGRFQDVSDKILEVLGPGEKRREADLLESTDKLVKYVSGYEEIAWELQRTVEYLDDGDGPLVRVRFKNELAEDGYYSLIEKPDEFLEEFTEALGFARAGSEVMPQVVVVKAFGSLDGSSFYNRQATLARVKAVKEQLRTRFSGDELRVLGVPLGKSQTPTDGEDWRFAEVRILPTHQVMSHQVSSELGSLSDEYTRLEVPERTQLVQHLEVDIETSDRSRAGTEARVSLEVGGESYRIEGTFSPGDKSMIHLELRVPQTIDQLKRQQIVLSHDDSGWFPAWDVERVRVHYSTNGEDYQLLGEWSDVGQLGGREPVEKILFAPGAPEGP